MRPTVQWKSSQLFEVTLSTSWVAVNVQRTLAVERHVCWEVIGRPAISPSVTVLWSGSGGPTTVPTITSVVTSLKIPFIPKYSFPWRSRVPSAITDPRGMRRLCYTILWSIMALQMSLMMTLTMVVLVWNFLCHRLLINANTHGYCMALYLCLRCYWLIVCTGTEFKDKCVYCRCQMQWSHMNNFSKHMRSTEWQLTVASNYQCSIAWVSAYFLRSYVTCRTARIPLRWSCVCYIWLMWCEQWFSIFSFLLHANN